MTTLLRLPRLAIHAASAACLLAGPCFQLNVENRVVVDRSGSSRRTTLVQTTDTNHADVRTALPEGDVKQNLIALVTGAFAPTAPEFAPSVDSKNGAALTRTREVAPGELAQDLTLHRRGRRKGAGNAAVVRVDDYVLFQRVRYVETIGDSADTQAAGSAADALAAHLCQIIQRAAEDLLARDYDAGALQQYLLTTGKRALRDLLVSSIDANADHPAVVETMVQFFDREKIDVDAALFRRFAAGELDAAADRARLVKSLRDGLLKKTAQLLRRHGATPDSPGAPIAVEDLDRQLTPDALARAFERAVEGVTRKPLPEWHSSLTRSADDLYGSFGGALFDPDLGADSVSWTTRIRMPGLLLRTSGTPLPSGEILWHFLSCDLALRQTPCTAESIVLDDRAIAALGGTSSGIEAPAILELLAELGAGRERRPVKSKCQTLTDAVNGDAAARERLRKHDDFDTARRVLRLNP